MSNDLDTHVRRNRLSGSTAEPSDNPLTRSRLRTRRGLAAPLARLGLIWKVAVDGVPLIEQMVVEASGSEEWSGALREMAGMTMRGEFAKWAELHSEEDLSRIAAGLRECESRSASILREWVERIDLKSDGSAYEEYLIGYGGQILDAALRGAHGDEP